MEFAISLGLGGWIAVIVVALVFGAAAQLVGEAGSGFEWLADGIAFGLGAIVASEMIVAWRGFEPVFDGLAIVPAVIGGAVAGVVVELATRYLTGGTYTSRAVSA